MDLSILKKLERRHDAITLSTFALIERLNILSKRKTPIEESVKDDIQSICNTLAGHYADIYNKKSQESIVSFLDLVNFIQSIIRNGSIEINDVSVNISRRQFADFKKHTRYLQVELASLIELETNETVSFAQPIVPEDRPAPIRVGVLEGGLALLHPQTRTGSIDYPSANKIRESLRDTLSDLLDELPAGSNADPRYLKACGRLLDHLSTPLERTSIEALGLNYQLVERMTKRLKEEMGGSAIDEIEHTLTGISVLLNQFQEWREYLQELALTTVDFSNSEGLVVQASQLIEDIEATQAPVDPRIAVRLREMIEPVTSGLINADTIAAPLVGSLSNIFSVLSRIAMESVAAASAVGPSLPGLGASAILTGFAVATLQKFCPTITQYQPFKFIIDVLAFFVKFYTPIKDSTKAS